MSTTGAQNGVSLPDCPNCGQAWLDIIGLVAPEDQQLKTQRAGAGGLAGALGGGLLGATFGPGGLLLGMAGGSLLVGGAASENAGEEVYIECTQCGNREHALVPNEQLPNHLNVIRPNP